MDKITPLNTPHPAPQKVAVIIVAAGSGSRFGGDTPKQYQNLREKPVLRHTIERFVNHPSVTDIQVVIGEGFQDLYEDSINGLNTPKLLPPVTGGATRQQSVYNALKQLSLNADDLVLIHDAARPCLPAEKIDAVIDSLKINAAVSLAVPVSDTLRKSNEQSQLLDIVDRTHLYAMQTPQAFHYHVIRNAHETLKSKDFTDDTSLVTEMDIPVFIVGGARENIKITHPEDMIMAEKFLTSQTLIPRTGIGFDVHAFGDAASHIRIGGVDIPHSHKLKGHSDADVLLHAITDALYGVIADGDIGSHFPPSNMAYKGKDSAFFLEEAVKSVRTKGGRIVHIDSVIMCEAPKIGPHRDAIQKRVADILGINPSRVSIKATTTEELGFTGRREGIAAQAVVTVLLPDEVADVV